MLVHLHNTSSELHIFWVYYKLFAGAIVLGPRIDRFKDDNSKYISGHSIPLVSLGGFILIFGFFAFNAGSQVGNFLSMNWSILKYIIILDY